MSNTSLPTVTPTQPTSVNQTVSTNDTQKTILNGNMFAPLNVFQNREIKKVRTKIVPNIRSINQVREGRLVIGTLLDLLDAAPFDPRQNQTVAGAVAVIRRVEMKP